MAGQQLTHLPGSSPPLDCLLSRQDVGVRYDHSPLSENLPWLIDLHADVFSSSTKVRILVGRRDEMNSDRGDDHEQGEGEWRREPA